MGTPGIQRFASRMLRRLSGLGLALAALTIFSADDWGLREEELECENALAHLQSCCPNFDAHQIGCTSDACGPEPDIPIGTSLCLQQRECSALEQQGYCNSLVLKGALGKVDGVAPRPRVCP